MKYPTVERILAETEEEKILEEVREEKATVAATWKFCKKCARMTKHDNGECAEH